MDFYRPDFPTSGRQLAFNAGKKYVLNHLLHAIYAEYDKLDEGGGLMPDDEI